jgi:23S rRNA (guanosine2251-2'-O)-methyltransferase
MKSAGYWIIGLDGGISSNPVNKSILQGKIGIVLGAEGVGMRRLTKQSCDYIGRIPISDKVESLNVSNAAAIIFALAASNVFSN